MFRFPLIEWFENIFVRWLDRPDDYNIERWSFYKKLLWGSFIFAIILGVVARVLDIYEIIGAIIIFIVIVGSVTGIGKKEERKKWKQDWFRGKYGKYEIFKHW